MITILTGAGVSTDSGIPDFRGPQGLWRQFPDYEKLVDLEAYSGDPAIRKRAWQFREASPARTAEPNVAHLALAELERKGALDTVITQNIDRLHQKAGLDDERVVELHGDMFGIVCLGCDFTSTLEEVLERVRSGEEDPACERCGGVLKTTTVMFGEFLSPQRLKRAEEAAERAEVFAAIGTSLQVYPAAALVGIAARAGAEIVIVNADPTPYDGLADEIVREPISTAVPELVERLAARAEGRLVQGRHRTRH
ncbi:SIR2 family NAD-dependent protein deacylase [Salininema proteolyticum]|uniref:protein acetyllysine N-acetyltransferase n=1 Tax=Salininema proteolyticum TaxID=1607685 RepID=A0ABV8U096_9ACTN